MKLVDKLKEYFNREEDVEVIEEESVYKKIFALLDDYKKNALPEVERLKGHTHFLKTEIEEKILKLIEEDPTCLRDQSINSTNIY